MIYDQDKEAVWWRELSTTVYVSYLPFDNYFIFLVFTSAYVVSVILVDDATYLKMKL